MDNSQEASKGRILMVDDAITNLEILKSALSGRYTIQTAMDGLSALEIARVDTPDLILLDIIMPGLDGYAVCASLKNSPGTADIPIIFLSAVDSPADKSRAFELGAVDFIAKPFAIQEVQARVNVHVALLMARRELRKRNDELEHKVADRTRELSQTQAVIIEAMAGLAETRDTDTGDHILRTRLYVEYLGRLLMRHPRFENYFKDVTPEEVGKAAILHDIGKVGVPDSILLKPDALTDSEFAIIQQHPSFGHDVFSKALHKIKYNRFLALADDIAWGHHEKWDGTGYPRKLKGDEIPIPARLMALADVYDAITTKRVYKQAMRHEAAADYIKEQSGRHFDPDIVKAFLENCQVFKNIALKYRFAPEVEHELFTQDNIDWEDLTTAHQDPE